MKPRYDILDGLRGVAAICVLVSHLFEAIAFANGDAEQNCFHGFLAVDFFFILSGFVMSYAYDDRWRGHTYLQKGRTDGMGIWDFCKRRLIRLHPMVVVGVLFGVLAFCIQGCTKWDGTEVSWSVLLVGTLLSLCMLPTPASLEVRGNTEIFPLNGPHWSLFFEYLGSILYAVLLVRMSTKVLRWWVTIAAFALMLFVFTLGEGFIGNGWSSEPSNLLGGALRLLFAYPMGMLLARKFREEKPSTTSLPAFLISAVALVVLLSVPSISTLTGWAHANTWYQLLCVTVFFPMLVYFGARGAVSGKQKAVVGYLGRLSYPLYAIHYPLIYLYIHWINTGQHPFGPYAWSTPVALFVIAIVLATVLVKYYDEPARNFLNKKYN